MAEMMIFEDADFFYIRPKDYDQMDPDAESVIPFDEDLSVLVGLREGDDERRIECIGVNLSKEAFDAEDAEDFKESYDIRFFTTEEEDIIVPPIDGCVELSTDYGMEGWLVMLIRDQPPFASIRDQLDAMEDMMDEEDMFMEMDDDFPFEFPYRDTNDPDEYQLPDNRDLPLLDLFLEKLDDSEEDPESVVAAMDALEPYVIADVKDPKLIEYMDEYVEFYTYFMDNYSDDEELLDWMETNRPEPPLLLHVGSYMYEKFFVQEALAREDELTREQIEVLNKLIAYVKERDTNRMITIMVADGMKYEVEIEKGMKGDELQERLDFLRAYLLEFFRENCVMYIQFEDENLGKVIMNGFSSINGTVRKMPINDVKQTLDLQEGWEEQIAIQLAFLDI